MSIWKDYLAEILIEAEPLQARVKELGQQISADYAGKDLLLICILKGGVPFLTDLMRQISLPHEIDFLAVSSYERGARASVGVVRIIKDLDEAIEGRHVIIVEDIIDSGNTLNYITRLLQERRPASIKICTLLDKFERREVEIPVDYVGFPIEDKYVFGYGLDLDEKLRNLPFVGVAKI